MSHASSASRPRSAWRLPVLITFLALILGGIWLWCYGERATPDQEARLARAKERLASLRAEKAGLEDLLRRAPCDARALLETASPLPIPPATPARETPPPAVPATKGTPPSSVPAATPASSAAPAADTVSLLERACVFIVSADATGDISTGSGFFVTPEHILTNAHTVPDGVQRVLVTSKALGRPVIATLVARDSSGERDYALLRIAPPREATIAVPSFATTPRRTEKVGAWGFPHVIGQNDPAYTRLLNGSDPAAVPELVYSEGVVSALLNRTPPLIVHTAPISPGNSGGPLVNAQGQIVGMNSMITLDEDSYRQASIAIAAHDLIRFLATQGITVSESGTPATTPGGGS